MQLGLCYFDSRFSTPSPSKAVCNRGRSRRKSRICSACPSDFLSVHSGSLRGHIEVAAAPQRSPRAGHGSAGYIHARREGIPGHFGQIYPPPLPPIASRRNQKTTHKPTFTNWWKSGEAPRDYLGYVAHFIGGYGLFWPPLRPHTSKSRGQHQVKRYPSS